MNKKKAKNKKFRITLSVLFQIYGYFIRMIRSEMWIGISTLILCFEVALLLFLKLNYFRNIDIDAILEKLLTINSLFSAILITYLFSNINWIKDRKLSFYHEAVKFSRKLTEFRRILDKLTTYYRVWKYDNATKILFNNYKFRKVDFYEFRSRFSLNRKPSNKKILNMLYGHDDFIEGHSDVYLAMISIVKNRKSDAVYYPELYKDYERDQIYNLGTIDKWRDIEIFATISYWLGEEKIDCIKYRALENDKRYILEAAKRIDQKYSSYTLDNKLIAEISEDFHEHYLNELYKNLYKYDRGLDSISKFVLLLVFFSLLFGVIVPFILILFPSQGTIHSNVAFIAISINIGTILFFILRLRSLIRKQIKNVWI